MTSNQPTFAFPKAAHLRKQAEFDRVYATNAYAADGLLVANVALSEHPFARLGLSISRKHGCAVIRNRWKRLIREAFRLTRAELPPGLDLVVRPQRGAVPEFTAILRSLPEVARRAAKKLRSNARPQP